MLSSEHGSLKIIVLSIVFVVFMYYFDLYDSATMRNLRAQAIRLIEVLGTVYILSRLFFYLCPHLEMHRGVLPIGLAFVALLLLFSRNLFLVMNNHSPFVDRALIVGTGSLAETLLGELALRPELGIRVVGQLKSFENGNEQSTLVSSENHLETLLKPIHPDRIIVALGDRRGNLPVGALLQLKRQGVSIQDGAELYEVVTGKIAMESLCLSSLLFSPGFHVSRARKTVTRVFSLLVCCVGLIVALPWMALIALSIRLDSAGPAIFRQKRVGQDGKLFTLYKFRTMVQGADGNGNHRPAQLSDGRFTRVGRLLRRTRLDELPQLVNILRGEMNVVGPRPFVPDQEQECSERIPYYRQRWAVKPGATGWAQVNRGYNVTIEDNKEKLAYDLFYIKHISIGLDLFIVFKTIKILLLGRGSR
jgi:exopolysaccharide biosynthesis polyprenyl glycosylphosphotransferase